MTDFTAESQHKERADERLKVRTVMGGAFALYRMEPGRIALAALLTFIPIDVVTVELHGLAEHLLEIGHTGLSVGAQLFAFFLVSGGQVFLAGILDQVVGARLANRPALTLLEAALRVPLGRLIVADILVSAMAAVASLAFIVPGIVVFALFGIVGPVINIEDRGVVDALKRSAQLVRPHLWLACVVIVAPFLIEFAIEDWYVSFAHGVPLLPEVAVSVALSVSARAYISLLEVILGHTLIHADRREHDNFAAQT